MEYLEIPDFNMRSVDLTIEAKRSGFTEADHFAMSEKAWGYFVDNTDPEKRKYAFTMFMLDVMDNCEMADIAECMFSSGAIKESDNPTSFMLRKSELAGKSLVMVLLYEESMEIRERANQL